MNVANLKFDQEVCFTKKMKHFTDIPDLNPMPNNSIIHKTLTGIGATYSEIKAHRSSIIVLPHISIVISKHEQHKETDGTLAIYGDITLQEIYDYLMLDTEYAKILTTPKGLNKVIKVINTVSESNPHITYKNLFFLLIDECHKFIKDADYRSDMIEVMEHYFTFENKAMVSATPIPPSDPRFKENRKLEVLFVTVEFLLTDWCYNSPTS